LEEGGIRHALIVAEEPNELGEDLGCRCHDVQVKERMGEEKEVEFWESIERTVTVDSQRRLVRDSDSIV
jgi:hypothetical protein